MYCAPPMNLKKQMNVLARLYVGGCDKGSERLPTQFLGRLRVSVPTPGVDEVWDHIAILAYL